MRSYFKLNPLIGRNRGRDLIMRRVRFKPGYQRLWREARKAINFVLGMQVRYQSKLTKKLMRLRKVGNLDSMKLLEFNLIQILISSRFLFDQNSANELISSGLVSINGHLTQNKCAKVFQGDFLQIIVTLRYYVVHK